MKSILLLSALLSIGLVAQAQTKTPTTVLKPASAVSEDSTQLHKIIPAEIPQSILDSLQKRNVGMQDISSVHRNGAKSAYVVEVTHDLVKDIYWFDSRGHQIRPKTQKGNN